MIKAKKRIVAISGDPVTVSIELMYIIHSFRNMCIDNGISGEKADNLIATIGKAAYNIEDEDIESIEVIPD